MENIARKTDSVQTGQINLKKKKSHDPRVKERKYLLKRQIMIAIIGGFVVIVSNFLFLVFRYIVAIKRVQEFILNNNVLYIILGTFLPFLWWAYSTKEDAWNFYDVKNRNLRLVILNAILISVQIVWTFVFNLLVFRICRIPVQRNMTETMILNLCRIALVGITGAVGYGIYALINNVISSDEMQETINGFRWQYVVDTRKNKKAMYDLRIIKDMKTGAEIPIKQIDRMVHLFLLGQSGTGKTSSAITPAIICDLDKKLDNAVRRVNAKVKMIKAGHAYVGDPDHNGEYTEYSVRPEKGFEKELDSINKENPDCGITMMAPNRSIISDAIRLCKARSLRMNVIDPMFVTYDDKIVSRMGINPFYVSPDLYPEEAQIAIKNKAQNFSEVLMAINEINGQGDQYFRDINTSVTTNIAILCMLRAFLKERQTSINEVHERVRDFEKMRPIVEEIQKILHVKIVITEVPSRDNKHKQARSADDKKEKEEVDVESEKTVSSMITSDVTDENEVPEKYKNMGMTAVEYTEVLHKMGEDYYGVIYTALTELLGSGAEKMRDQSRGLRNIMDKLLLDPRIKKILSASEDGFIDWDKALAENEITFINTALEIGPHASTGLGLFLMLDMKISIMRRPENTRTPHFLMIDEASQYMHPMIEDMFALYRQYGVACTLAMQSLSQLEKSPLTKFLSGVIMGAGIHIVYGRLSPKEMEIYETMAGKEDVEVIQESINSNSEFDDNYNVSQGMRTSIQEKNRMDGYRMRLKNFQEVTVFMINEGRVLSGFAAKVSFPKKTDYMDKNAVIIDFEKMRSGDYTPGKEEIIRKHKEERREKSERIALYKTGISHIHDSDDISEDQDTPTAPIALDEEARRRRGKGDIYKAKIGDTSALDKAAERAAAIADRNEYGNADEEPEAAENNTPDIPPAKAPANETPKETNEPTEEDLDEELRAMQEQLDNEASRAFYVS